MKDPCGVQREMKKWGKPVFLFQHCMYDPTWKRPSSLLPSFNWDLSQLLIKRWHPHIYCLFYKVPVSCTHQVFNCWIDVPWMDEWFLKSQTGEFAFRVDSTFNHRLLDDSVLVCLTQRGGKKSNKFDVKAPPLGIINLRQGYLYNF